MDAKRQIKITWRHENYGEHKGEDAGFRLQTPPGITNTEARQIVATARNVGFAWSPSRNAWIGADVDMACAFVEAIAATGIAIVHAGRWPQGPARQR
jgi:hypothetical protein